MAICEATLLTGQSDSHLVDVGGGVLLHRDASDAFSHLQNRAAENGIDLKIASSFRSFERQLAIWNAKACGQRPVLDDNSQPLDLARLTALQQVCAIMRWSALPGASRHHWGTDIDVWDGAAVPAEYSLQLVAQEYRPDGPFARLGNWLQQLGPDWGFYRPYEVDRGGIAPEPWHLSYQPLADQYAKALTPHVLAQTLIQADIELKTTVLDNLDTLFTRFIRVGGAPS